MAKQRFSSMLLAPVRSRKGTNYQLLNRHPRPAGITKLEYSTTTADCTDLTTMAYFGMLMSGDHYRRARAGTDLRFVRIMLQSALSTPPEAAVGRSDDTISTSTDYMSLKGHADYFEQRIND